MRRLMVALVVALALPLSAFAQEVPADANAVDSDHDSFVKNLAITTGFVGGIVVADLLTGGTLTAPVLGIFGLRTAAPVAVAAAGATLPPAMAEARAAGAVLGEQITGATAARDIAARRDLVRVGILGAGGLMGRWLFLHLFN